MSVPAGGFVSAAGYEQRASDRLDDPIVCYGISQIPKALNRAGIRDRAAGQVGVDRTELNAAGVGKCPGDVDVARADGNFTRTVGKRRRNRSGACDRAASAIDQRAGAAEQASIEIERAIVGERCAAEAEGK